MVDEQYRPRVNGQARDSQQMDVAIYILTESTEAIVAANTSGSIEAHSKKKK